VLPKRVDGNANFLYGLPKLVFGDAEFTRPIFELVSLIDVHAGAVLRAAVLRSSDIAAPLRRWNRVQLANGVPGKAGFLGVSSRYSPMSIGKS